MTEIKLYACAELPDMCLRIHIIVILLVNFVGKCLSHDEGMVVDLQGDVILGGLFPMHESNNSHYETGNTWNCGDIKEDKGIQRLEAMLYAIDMINKDPDLLPDITLGALIFDTCSYPSYGMDQSVEFVRSSICQPGCSKRMPAVSSSRIEDRRRIVGVIGAASSSVSVKVAEMLRLFRIPQISYASSSTELSDKNRFEFFSRVVPPDTFQAQAMVDIVKALGFDHVMTIADEGEYGEEGIQAFIDKSKKEQICISKKFEIRDTHKMEDFRGLIREMPKETQQQVVVMFVNEDHVRKLLTASAKENQTDHFIWIASDAWGTKMYPVKKQETAAEHAITILPKRIPLEGFDTYFKSLRPDTSNYCKNQTENIRSSEHVTNCRNPWFTEYWQKRYDCFLSGSTNMCPTNQKITDHVQEGLVPFVVDAVYAMSHAIHNFLRDHCGWKNKNCSELSCGESLLPFIRNVSFIGAQNHTVSFNKNGDVHGNYNIYQYQRKGNKYEYVLIGEWSRTLSLNKSLTTWKRNNIPIPNKPCNHECGAGYIRNYYSSCCWNCVPCNYSSYVNKNKCEPCPRGKMPYGNKTYCKEIPLEYMDWSSSWVIAPVMFCVLGMLFTTFVILVFFEYRNTPVIMASSRELCCLLLCGIMLCYFIPFFILAKPTEITCTIRRLFVNLPLCLCYSAILTKTNRIFRIFNRSVKTKRVPMFVSSKAQIGICLVIWSVQLFINVFWIIVQPTEVIEKYPSWNTAVLSCGFDNVRVIMAMSYNKLLVLLCTVYAFKSRRIPENFNEAKFISFTMYSSCIVWLAFLAVYLSTTNNYKMNLTCECVVICICASVILGCFFAPKIYIVLFQPQKNIRKLSTKSLSSNSNHPARVTPQNSGQIAEQTASTC